MTEHHGKTDMTLLQRLIATVIDNRRPKAEREALREIRWTESMPADGSWPEAIQGGERIGFERGSRKSHKAGGST